MLDPKLLDQLAQRLADAVPPGVREAGQDLEKNFHAVLQSAFAKLNLITREEFDVQKALLERTRAKLDELEKQIQALEAQAHGTAPPQK